MNRTHLCGQLRETHIGNKATLCGWVHSRRDHGGLSFIDLRDRSGLVQVVFNAKKDAPLHERANTLGPEYVISVTGLIGRRPKGTENPSLASGIVELIAESMQILNQAVAPPFEVDDKIDASEEVRMQWRYLDLRRPLNLKRLALRHRIIHRIREAMDGLEFLEIETPILTRSTPEGARDYLVPSRLNPGHFFALPQSPQLFKQLLMVAGLERYFQIARCFRDEDLRADRQPEFTQFDIEMSFVDEADIFSVVETVLAAVFKDVLGQSIETPFPRLTYAKAQEKYHTERPNTQTKDNPWAFCWINDFPLFEWNDETKSFDAQHHPFTSPHPDDVAYLEEDPRSVRACAYDLVLNGVELGSGSIRIHDENIQRKIFKVLGLSDHIVQERFGFLLKAFTYGAPPHGGFALGLDRFVAIVAQAPSIRDVIAFPKTQKALDPVVGAPAAVSEIQLKELGLAVLNTKPPISSSAAG